MKKITVGGEKKSYLEKLEICGFVFVFLNDLSRVA